jgi:hypothetical protein
VIVYIEHLNLDVLVLTKLVNARGGLLNLLVLVIYNVQVILVIAQVHVLVMGRVLQIVIM